MSDNGKGDTPRPVNPRKFASGWERVYKRKKPKEAGAIRTVPVIDKHGQKVTTLAFGVQERVPETYHIAEPAPAEEFPPPDMPYGGNVRMFTLKRNDYTGETAFVEVGHPSDGPRNG